MNHSLQSAKLQPGAKILVGLSGGVDSSVSVALLQEQGYQVTAGFIKNWSDTKDLWTGECGWRAERRDALRVAAKLGVSLLTFDFEADYRARVLDRMFAEYQAGLTPNPDVLCNEEIKFGLFFQAAMKLGFDGVATGHYARVFTDESGVAHLLKGLDPNKDQSYFLHRISPESLERTLFPVGHLLKEQVRAEATRFGLPTAAKPDSQGICFVGKLDFHEFLRKKIPSSPGEIVTSEGVVVGKHDGLDAYTIGQRQGLQVSKDQRSWYVAAKDEKKNQLIIVPDREHPLLFSKSAVLTNVHWLSSNAAQRAFTQPIQVAIRYRQTPQTAWLEQIGEQARVTFAEPVWALAPGQSAVVYLDEECLGGGFLAHDSVG